MTAVVVTNPTEEQTRRALAWARSPAHPSVLALLDGCPDLIWIPTDRALISVPDDGIPIVEIWLDGADLWMEVEHDELGSAGRFLRIPPHIIDAETPT